jgi:hypothetical protein
MLDNSLKSNWQVHCRIASMLNIRQGKGVTGAVNFHNGGETNIQLIATGWRESFIDSKSLFNYEDG